MKERTDKPKFKGQFVGHVVKTTRPVMKSCSWEDKDGEKRFRRVLGKVTKVAWTWNGKEWVS